MDSQGINILATVSVGGILMGLVVYSHGLNKSLTSVSCSWFATGSLGTNIRDFFMKNLPQTPRQCRGILYEVLETWGAKITDDERDFLHDLLTHYSKLMYKTWRDENLAKAKKAMKSSQT